MIWHNYIFIYCYTRIFEVDILDIIIHNLSCFCQLRDGKRRRSRQPGWGDTFAKQMCVPYKVGFRYKAEYCYPEQSEGSLFQCSENL